MYSRIADYTPFALALLLLGGAVSGCAVESGSASAGVEDVGQSAQEIRGDQINNVYRHTMGREPFGFEIDYWKAQKDFDNGVVIGYTKTWLASASGTTDRLETIKRTYKAEYGRAPSNFELTYWDGQSTSHGGYTFAEMMRWLRDYGSSNYSNSSTGSVTYLNYTQYVGWWYDTLNTYSVPPG